MFQSKLSVTGFLTGVALTVGLLLSPHLVPGGLGYRAGYQLNWLQIVFLTVGGLLVLSAALWGAGRLIKGAQTWKQPKIIFGTILIAFTANALYIFLVELFALKSGMRALVAVAGVPIIYGNLGAVLGKTSLKDSMLNIFTCALATMGAGFIIASIIMGW